MKEQKKPPVSAPSSTAYNSGREQPHSARRGVPPSSPAGNRRPQDSRTSANPINRKNVPPGGARPTTEPSFRRPAPNPAKEKAPERPQTTGKRPARSFLPPRIKLFVAVGGILLALGVCMLINIMIGIQTVEVKGNTLCRPEEILSAAGISVGNGYFSYNTSGAEQKLLKTVPCIAKAHITRSVFGRVTVTVQEKKAYWYTETCGEYFALSENLEVVKNEALPDRFRANGMVRIDFPEVRSAILGEPLEYYDGDRDLSFMSGFLEKIQASEFYKAGRMNGIVMKSKFEISVFCDLKYKIILGDSLKTEIKLSKTFSVLEQSRFADDSKWVLDVSGVENVTAYPEPNLDVSKYK